MMCIILYAGLWKRPAKLVFTGLDNTGKTTMLYILNDGHVNHNNYSSKLFQPTTCYMLTCTPIAQATVTIGDVYITIYELCCKYY